MKLTAIDRLAYTGALEPVLERACDNYGIEKPKKRGKKIFVIPVANLPTCFVHGDFTKANILKGDDGKIYILDFSVSNWYPRIQELAVIIANLLHDAGGQSLAQKCELVAKEYGALNTLTNDECKYLYSYALAGVAMEFMGAHQEKFINGNDTEETEYRLNLGREGLRREIRKINIK